MGAMVNLTHYVLYQMKYHFTYASNLYQNTTKGCCNCSWPFL